MRTKSVNLESRIRRANPVARATGAGAAAALFLLAGHAGAADAHMKLTGSTLGTLKGGSTSAGHAGEFDVLGFTPSSASEFKMTLPLDGLPLLFTAMTRGEPLDATITFDNPAAGGSPKPGYVAKAQKAFVTEISLSAKSGKYYSADVTLTAADPAKCTDGAGSTALLPSLPLALPSSSGNALQADPIRDSRAGTTVKAVPLAAIEWKVTAPAPIRTSAAGKPTLGAVSFSKPADKNSATLANAVAHSDAVAGSRFKWLSRDPSGRPAEVFSVEIVNGKLDTGTATAGATPSERYSVQLVAPRIDGGGGSVKLTQTTPGSAPVMAEL
jgi:type VI protein secretion system component Hcp